MHLWLRVATAVAIVAAPIGCAPARDPSEAAGLAPCRALRRAEIPAGSNLVLIVNDAMRRDRVGAYGGDAHTPSFDSFAGENLVFRRAVSPAPWTVPSIASLFTSRYPSQHGVASHPEAAWHEAVGGTGAAVLSESFETLAETLHDAGFRTAAFVANPWLTRGFGFEQGFEIYDDSFASWEAPGSLVSEAGLAWLASLEPDERFFLYLHYIDTHIPYGALREEDLAWARTRDEEEPRRLPGEAHTYFMGLRLESGRRILHEDVEPSLALLERAYDRGVESFDRALGAFLRGFRSRPEYARSAVVVTSDHGEALFERGYGNHGRALYEDEVAIPLAARLPNVESVASEVECPVSLVDLTATLCDYLGVRCAEAPTGVSLLASEGTTARSRPRPPRYVVSEGVPRYAEHRAIQNDRYKLIFAPRGVHLGARGKGGSAALPARPYALFDLRDDPTERHDLLAQQSLADDVAEIGRALQQALPRAVPVLAAPAQETRPLDPALRRRLRDLGYLSDEPPARDR
jgi:arylsulfatase